MWDAKTGAQLRIFKGHTDLVMAVAFNKDASAALTGSGDNTARLWDTKTGEQIQLFKEHTRCVSSVAFFTLEFSDGELIGIDRLALTKSADNISYMWDVKTGRPFDLAAIRGEANQPVFLKGHTNHVTSVAFSLDGKTAVTAAQDGTARLWDVKAGKLIKILKGELTKTLNGYVGYSICSVAFSPDGETVLTGCGDKTAGLFGC